MSARAIRTLTHGLRLCAIRSALGNALGRDAAAHGGRAGGAFPASGATPASARAQGGRHGRHPRPGGIPRPDGTRPEPRHGREARAGRPDLPRAAGPGGRAGEAARARGRRPGRGPAVAADRSPGRRRPVGLRRHPRRRRQQLDGDASGAEVAAPAAGAATVAGRLAPLAPAICGDRVRAPAVQTAVPVRRPTSAR